MSKLSLFYLLKLNECQNMTNNFKVLDHKATHCKPSWWNLLRQYWPEDDQSVTSPRRVWDTHITCKQVVFNQRAVTRPSCVFTCYRNLLPSIYVTY